MNEREQKAVMSICLAAAFSDGSRDERERGQLQRISESLAPGSPLDLPGLYQDVLMRRSSLEQAVADLPTPEAKQFAYEMAVCVCDADGAHSDSEKAFLDRLRVALGLERAAAGAFASQAAELANTPLASGGPVPSANQGELDKMVLNYSILNGALELLPQSLASMAILPLQTKMVYRIGKAYGFELDRGHIKDFAATLGVGFAGQYLEQMGRKLIGGLFERLGGGLLGGIGSVATGSAFSFATTYAMGKVAIQYYAGGRTIDMNQLKQVFESLFQQGKDLQNLHMDDIRQKARTLDLNEISRLVKDW